ncbi:3'(2'),5'-bisphosphate nucleotidase CysQ [Fibrobacterales bacterium]|nr:3'(2'),5'-bisphosphate nucleotidase CysQ [Fibrobacterales bacterium]
MDVIRGENAILDAVERAAKVALEIYNTDFSVETKSDGSPLTKADLAVNEILIKTIKNNFPSELIVSEESKLPNGIVPPNFFLIDPIDGTTDFVKRTGEWTINVAWIENYKAKWGIISVPALGEIFVSSRLSKVPQERDGGKETATRVLISVSHRDPKTDELIRKISNREEIAVGSSLKFCRLATNSADYYPRAIPLHEWDIAAGHAILKAAGGNIYKLGTQTELTYGNSGFETSPFEAFSSLSLSG